MSAPLDERERTVALSAAGLAAVASVALWAPNFEHAEAVVLAGVGVALAVFLGGAALSRRRLVTGLAAMLLAFGPWAFAWVIGFPYVCLAAWLLFRHGRTRAARPERPEGAEGRRRSKDEPAPARARPARPEANKRYTPPQRKR